MTDLHLVRALLGLHAVPNPRILDASYGRGGIWRGLPYQPTRLDARALDVDVVGRWERLGDLFEPASFQIVVWDPPHQAGGGQRALGGDWSDRYGTDEPELRGYLNIDHLVAPFLVAARVVLDPRVGCVIVKIADEARSGGLQQLQHNAFINVAKDLGWTVCECQPLFSGVKPDDPRWMRQQRLRKSHCYWIVAHPGPRCRADGVLRSATCPYCGRRYAPRRSDQHTCGSDLCRQRRHRTVARP